MTKYSPDFKFEVVTYYSPGRGGHQRVADKFSIPKISLRTWLNAYLKKLDALIQQQERSAQDL